MAYYGKVHKVYKAMYLQHCSDLPAHGDHFPTSADKNIKIPKDLDLHTEHEDLHTLASIIYLRYVGRKVL